MDSIWRRALGMSCILFGLLFIGVGLHDIVAVPQPIPFPASLPITVSILGRVSAAQAALRAWYFEEQFSYYALHDSGPQVVEQAWYQWNDHSQKYDLDMGEYQLRDHLNRVWETRVCSEPEPVSLSQGDRVRIFYLQDRGPNNCLRVAYVTRLQPEPKLKPKKKAHRKPPLADPCKGSPWPCAWGEALP